MQHPIHSPGPGRRAGRVRGGRVWAGRVRGGRWTCAGRVRAGRWLGRVGLAAVLAGLLLVPAGGPAGAHALLRESDPAAGSSLERAPSRVVEPTPSE